MIHIDALVHDTRRRLEALADPARRDFTEGYFPTAQVILGVKTPDLRDVLRETKPRLKDATPHEVLAFAHALIDDGTLEGRQLAYEALAASRAAMALVDAGELERLGHGMDNWASVDTFSVLVAGPAWRAGQVADQVLELWAASPDRWWRRAAVVSTVALNLKARGGDGDVARTLALCQLVASDRDEMVAKGLSWALRELAKREPAAVAAFVEQHRAVLPARVRREVGNKLETGLKSPRAVNRV